MDSVTQPLINEFSAASGIGDLPEDKKFEHFTAFGIVSSRCSEEFDTEDLVAGDGHDLNVDSFAVKVNGRLAYDAEIVEDLLNLNGYLEVEFIIIQAKTSSKFDGAAIITLGDNLVNEIFSESRTMCANDDIKRLIEIKNCIFKHASKLKHNPSCRIYYACTGNWNDDDYLVKAIDRKRRELVDTNLFSEVSFEALGARALQSLFRATRTSISNEIKFDKLITLPSISDVSASYLGILPVTEYLKLITNGDGDIVKSVFIDNVRDFQGDNPVNIDIAQTIKDGFFDQFVLRNNGITIVAKNIKVTSSSYTLEDYQIVNGCQTSHVIFANKEAITDDLFVPVKLIHTKSEDVAQAIIRSTNKQTKVEDNDLLALTQFQRNLEDYFAGLKDELRLYYERRAKQYSGVSSLEKGRITTIGSQLKSYASMFLDSPHQASRYQGTLLKSVKPRVFQPDHNPEAYYTSAFAFYRFEVAIRRLPAEDRLIRAFKFYALLAFRYRFETSDYPGAASKKVSSYCIDLNN